MKNRFKNIGWILACAGMLIVCETAQANDGSVEIGAGGTVKLMHGRSLIRMLSEDIRLRPADGRVEVHFVFRNDGPAVTALIGFPEQGYSYGAEMPDSFTNFVGFRSYVDGKRVKVTRLVQHRLVNDSDGDYNYAYWWVKRVHFGKGQTRKILVRYQGGQSSNGVGSNLGFSYILQTGASWHGPIGHTHVVCDLRGIRDCGPLKLSPVGYRRIGDKVVWDMYNFIPKKNIKIGWIGGELHTPIKVEGKTVYSGYYEDRNSAHTLQRGREVWVSAGSAAKWLGAKLVIRLPGRTLRLVRGSRWAEIVLGQPYLRTSSGATIPLPNEAYASHGNTMVALGSLVKALGGRVSTDKEGVQLVSLH